MPDLQPLPQRYQRMLFAARPTGMPGPGCFRLEEAELTPPRQGEVLVRNEYLSVDPYIRMRMEPRDSYAPVMALGDVMVGRTVGQVVASQAEGWVPGEWVVGRLGWQTYSLTLPGELQRVDIQAAPATAWLGALGSTGVTAWIGLTLFGQPRRGQTVLVSAASGAVGSVVGQLARLAGCRAVGIAGGAEKCGIVREAYGFDDCIDYRAQDFASQLAAAVPGGVDVYFDNVGGEILDAVLPLMNQFGRIPVCGLVSQYNAVEPYGVKHLREVFNRRLTMRGFVISDHREHFAEATEALVTAYQAGRLHWRESIAQGLDQAPEAFLAVLQGRKIGKQLVKLQPGGAGEV
jgi:NADPH-dependent curcumin reductase